MKIIKFTTLLIILFACFGCHKSDNYKDKNFIDIENSIGKSRVVSLSEIAESVRYIPLETTPESILGELTSEHLIYENNKVFYKHKNMLKIFNSNGKYLSTFNRHGNGPKEYVSSSQVLIDSGAAIITIGSNKNIQEYKISGDFIRTIDLPVYDSLKDIIYSKLGKFNNKFFVLTSLIKNKDYNLKYSAIIIDSTSNVVLATKYPEKERDFVNKLPLLNRVSNISPSLFKYKDEIRIINGYDENIISIDKDLGIDTVYRLNYGKYNVNNLQNEQHKILERFKNFFESTSYLFMQFRTGTLPLKKRQMYSVYGKIISFPITCSVFNKQSGEFTFIDPCEINEFGFIDDFEGGPAIWPLYISRDDYMVSCIDAYKFIQYAQTHKVSNKYKQIASKLKDSDNPVLVLVKLK